jgi:hypothetical protein
VVGGRGDEPVNGRRSAGKVEGDTGWRADDCTEPALPSNGRDRRGRALAVDWANEIARASCDARVAGTASAGTCASFIVGPREALGTRYALLATPAVAAMYGRVRGAITPTRSEGTMYPRTRGENTYLDEQNT